MLWDRRARTIPFAPRPLNKAAMGAGRCRRPAPRRAGRFSDPIPEVIRSGEGSRELRPAQPSSPTWTHPPQTPAARRAEERLPAAPGVLGERAGGHRVGSGSPKTTPVEGGLRAAWTRFKWAADFVLTAARAADSLTTVGTARPGPGGAGFGDGRLATPGGILRVALLFRLCDKGPGLATGRQKGDATSGFPFQSPDAQAWLCLKVPAFNFVLLPPPHPHPATSPPVNGDIGAPHYGLKGNSGVFFPCSCPCPAPGAGYCGCEKLGRTPRTHTHRHARTSGFPGAGRGLKTCPGQSDPSTLPHPHPTPPLNLSLKTLW